MKHTSTRKKMLLSSVAMLLVAMMALGSATFAWFTQNNTAKATSLSVNTAKAANIVLCETNSDVESAWVSVLPLNISKTLNPVSTADLTSWFKTNSTIYNAAPTAEGGRGTVTAQSISDENNGYVVAKSFWVKSVAEDASVTATIKITSASAQNNYVRAAIVGTGDNKSAFYSNNTDDKACLNDTSGTPTTATVATEPSIDLTLEKDKGQMVTFYMWFEGEDPQCIDTAAGVTCNFEVEFVKPTSTP